MSCAMQDSIEQGFPWSFAKAMTTDIDNNVLVLLGSNYNVHHGYELEAQEHMYHPIMFHTKMMGNIMYLHQKPSRKIISPNLSKQS